MMRKTMFILPVAGMILLAAACSKNDSEFNDPNGSPEKSAIPVVHTISQDSYFFDVLKNTMSSSAKATKDAQPVYTNDQASLMVNETGSNLHRNSNGITVNWSVANAPNLDIAGHAVTLWALVWHSVDDLFAGMHPYAMYRVGGKVIGGNGNLNISGSLQEGQTADYYFTGPGSMPLQDAENNFIAFISKSHGPKDPAYMPAQILTFGGGCDGDPDGGGPLAPCSEWLYALHF